MKNQIIHNLATILLDNQGNRLTAELITGILNSLYARLPAESDEAPVTATESEK